MVLLSTPKSIQTHLQKKQNLYWSSKFQRPDDTPAPHTTTFLCFKQTRWGEGPRQPEKLILNQGINGLVGLGSLGPPNVFAAPLQRGHLRKAFVATEKAVGIITGPQLYSIGHDRPRHLHKIDGQTPRRPVTGVNIKGLFLYRYVKCTQAQTRLRLLMFVDYSFFQSRHVRGSRWLWGMCLQRLPLVFLRAVYFSRPQVITSPRGFWAGPECWFGGGGISQEVQLPQ